MKFDLKSLAYLGLTIFVGGFLFMWATDIRQIAMMKRMAKKTE